MEIGDPEEIGMDDFGEQNGRLGSNQVTIDKIRSHPAFRINANLWDRALVLLDRLHTTALLRSPPTPSGFNTSSNDMQEGKRQEWDEVDGDDAIDQLSL